MREKEILKYYVTKIIFFVEGTRNLLFFRGDKQAKYFVRSANKFGYS